MRLWKRFPGKRRKGKTINNANEKLVELWGGPHDGTIEKVDGTAEAVVIDDEWYQPVNPGDYAMNRFLHVSVKR
jgi:hypothetical protein